MSRFLVATDAGGAADAGEVGANLWNPHASMALAVRQVEVNAAAQTTDGFTVRLRRTTTQGGGGGTFTPDADNHSRRRAAPVSGAILRRGNFSSAPTVSGPALGSWHMSAPTGGMLSLWLPTPILVPAGTGLGVEFAAAVSSIAYAFGWEE